MLHTTVKSQVSSETGNYFPVLTHHVHPPAFFAPFLFQHLQTNQFQPRTGMITTHFELLSPDLMAFSWPPFLLLFPLRSSSPLPSAPPWLPASSAFRPTFFLDALVGAAILALIASSSGVLGAASVGSLQSSSGSESTETDSGFTRERQASHDIWSGHSAGGMGLEEEILHSHSSSAYILAPHSAFIQLRKNPMGTHWFLHFLRISDGS